MKTKWPSRGLGGPVRVPAAHALQVVLRVNRTRAGGVLDIDDVNVHFRFEPAQLFQALLLF